MLPPPEIAALLFVVGVLGGLVQGSIGFGLALVASPIIALVRPDLVPVAVLVAAPFLPLATLRREWRHADLKAFGWALAGRVPATALAAVVVAAVSTRTLQGVVGIIVLGMAALNLRPAWLPERPATLIGAGVLSGLGGTAAGIGGPPIALVLGHRDPARSRATLALTFLVGALLSLGTLWAAGMTRPDSLLAGLVLAPGTLVGFAVAVRVRERLSHTGFKAAVLLLSCAAAATLVVRAFVG